MTAIFAHVNGTVALIAADTLRVDPLGLFSPQTVTKVFAWAGCVLFAGAGNGPRLERLAQAVLAEQTTSTPDEAGFVAAFQKHQPAHYAAATSGTSAVTRTPQLSQGTFLVAVPELNGAPAHLFEIDFATGARTDLSLNVAAQGSDPPVFLSIAQSVLSSLSSSKPMPGDVWAAECIRQAVALRPNAVGLPFDLSVTKPLQSGLHTARIARLSEPPSTPDPDFAI